jgi:transcriptional antiterminator NusG
MIFCIRTISGREIDLAKRIASRVETNKLEISAILATEELKGYVFIETDNYTHLRRAIEGMRRIKVLNGTISIGELKVLLVSKRALKIVDPGDIVEILSGPFKGLEAIVLDKDEKRETVTVELKEAFRSMPVKIHAESVRLIQKAAKRKL